MAQMTSAFEQTVPVRREEVRIEREPITEGNATKDTVTDEETVSADLRKEQIEVEGER